MHDGDTSMLHKSHIKRRVSDCEFIANVRHFLILTNSGYLGEIPYSNRLLLALELYTGHP